MSRAPFNRYATSMILLLFIFSSITFAIVYWVSYDIAWLVGCGVAVLFSIPRLGANETNISEFVRDNQRYFE